MSNPRVPTTCPVCERDIPAGAFCGFCGSRQSSLRGDGPPWLRLRAFSAAPDEHVLRPSVASSLFPHLHRRSLAPFRIGLAVLLVALAVFAALRWQAPLVAVAALGLPVMFHLYLVEADAYKDFPRRTLLLTALLGVALGIGWASLTGAVIADDYSVAFGTDDEFEQPLWQGVGIPVGGAVAMLVPTLLARLASPGTRESLDGFVIGAIAAMSFTAAATLTRLAPQFSTGQLTDGPVVVLIAEAGIRGVAMSLTAAAAGGMVGTALWFTRPGPAHRHRWHSVAGPLLVLGVVLTTSAVLGLVDFSLISLTWQLLLHLLIAGLLMLALRFVLHLALLREAHDPITQETLVCEHCAHMVPDMAFCPACGVATRASSRSSRAARRQTHPTSNSRLLLQLGVAVGVLILGAVLAFELLTPPAQRYVCPPNCGTPPIGKPVQRLPRFTQPDGAFSVAYPPEGTAYDVTTNPHGVVAEFTGGDGGTMAMFSESAAGREPAEIAKALLREKYPDAETDYEIPNAMVGYHLGYGEVADVYPQDAAGDYARLRVLIMVAVKNDLALVAAAVGPYRRFTPGFGSGQPSGVNMQLALDMSKYVNSFTWRGDPPR